jgi:NTE family protein
MGLSQRRPLSLVTGSEVHFLETGGKHMEDWKDKPYGVALGGGGAKGSYQIGVWRAMRETGIRIGGLIGTSVGSLNAALFALGDLSAAESIWRGIRIDEVLGLDDGQSGDDRDSRWETNWRLTRIMARNGTFSMDPLRKLLKAHIDESRIRAAGIPFGLVTWSLSAMKPVVAFLEDIPEGQLHDYLLASCALPVFDNRLMGGDRYFDGSIYNNLPVEPLYQRGFRDILSISLSAPGNVRDFEAPDLHHVRIRNSEPLGGLLHLDPLLCERNFFLGYADAMKRFGALTGHRYTFTALAADECRQVNLRFDLDPGSRAAVHELSETAIIRIIHAIKGASSSGETTMDGLRELAAVLLGIPMHVIRSPGSLEGEIRREFKHLSQMEFMKQRARKRMSVKALAAFLKDSSEKPQAGVVALLTDHNHGQAFWEALALVRPEWVAGAWYLRRLQKEESREDSGGGEDAAGD